MTNAQRQSPKPRLLTIGLIITCFLAGLTFAQTSKELKNRAKGLEEKGQYAEAVDLLSQAFDLESSAREKKKIRKRLTDAKKRLFAEFVLRLQKGVSEEEALALFAQARALGVEGENGRRFKKVSAKARRLRQVLLLELGKRAAALADQKRLDEALVAYERARTLDEAMFREAGLQEGYDLTSSLRRQSRNIIAQAGSSLSERRFREAEMRYRQAEEIHPGQEESARGLKRIRDAEKRFHALRNEGDRLSREGALQEAIGRYREAVEAHPELAAEADLSSSISSLRGRSDLDGLFNGAQDAFRKGRWVEARDGFQKVLERRPDHPAAGELLKKAASRAYSQQGGKLAAAGRFKSADREYRKALDQDPGNTEAKSYLRGARLYKRHAKDGRWLLVKKRCEEAKSSLLKARRLSAARFKSDRLQPRLDAAATCQPVSAPVDVMSLIEEALESLLDSRPGEAIESLETAVQDAGELGVHVQAYLGASHAQLALIDQDTMVESLAAARKHFREALVAEPGYRLSARLFSPKVIAILEDLKGENTP